jgi:hypothetical protein
MVYADQKCFKKPSDNVLPVFDPEWVMSRPPMRGVGGSSRFFPQVHGGDGGGGSLSSSSPV